MIEDLNEGVFAHIGCVLSAVRHKGMITTDVWLPSSCTVRLFRYNSRSYKVTVDATLERLRLAKAYLDAQGLSFIEDVEHHKPKVGRTMEVVGGPHYGLIGKVKKVTEDFAVLSGHEIPTVYLKNILRSPIDMRMNP